jgi:chorismate mutase
MRTRAIRGATQLPLDTKEAMDLEVAALLEEMLRANDLTTDAVISALFTVTTDLVSEFPAASARRAGWSDVPMMCAVEISVPGALARTVRVMIYVETTREKREITHIYRGGAKVLRPDLAP